MVRIQSRSDLSDSGSMAHPQLRGHGHRAGAVSGEAAGSALLSDCCRPWRAGHLHSARPYAPVGVTRLDLHGQEMTTSAFTLGGEVKPELRLRRISVQQNLLRTAGQPMRSQATEVMSHFPQGLCNPLAGSMPQNSGGQPALLARTLQLPPCMLTCC